MIAGRMAPNIQNQQLPGLAQVNPAAAQSKPPMFAQQQLPGGQPSDITQVWETRNR